VVGAGAIGRESERERERERERRLVIQPTGEHSGLRACGVNRQKKPRENPFLYPLRELDFYIEE